MSWDAANSDVQSVVLNKQYPDLTNAKTVDKDLAVEVYLNQDKSIYTAAHFVKTLENGDQLELYPQRYHMHAPSEHTIAGRSLDFELHIVHLNADGTRAGVLGFMFDRELGGSGENPFLSQIVLPDPDYDN